MSCAQFSAEQGVKFTNKQCAMNKEELVEALKESGIVARDKDNLGAKIFVTLNDFDETMGEKASKAARARRLQHIQFWSLLITMICVVLTTLATYFSNNDYEYFQNSGYVLRYSPGSGETCVIPETPTIASVQQQLGKKLCH